MKAWRSPWTTFSGWLYSCRTRIRKMLRSWRISSTMWTWKRLGSGINVRSPHICLNHNKRAVSSLIIFQGFRLSTLRAGVTSSKVSKASLSIGFTKPCLSKCSIRTSRRFSKTLTSYSPAEFMQTSISNSRESDSDLLWVRYCSILRFISRAKSTKRSVKIWTS